MNSGRATRIIGGEDHPGPAPARVSGCAAEFCRSDAAPNERGTEMAKKTGTGMTKAERVESEGLSKIEGLLRELGCRYVGDAELEKDSVVVWLGKRSHYLIRLYRGHQGIEVYAPVTDSNSWDATLAAVRDRETGGAPSIAAELAQAVIDQGRDGLDRSEFILAKAHEFTAKTEEAR